jgi:hypothetical protein
MCRDLPASPDGAVEQPSGPLTGRFVVSSCSGDHYSDFKDIFAEKFGQTVGVFAQKYR